jgi:hypothetical protein
VFILKSPFFAGFLEFVIMVQNGTGNFEVFEGGEAVVTGTVRVPDISHETASLEFFEPQTSDDLLELSSQDIYTKSCVCVGTTIKGTSVAVCLWTTVVSV